MRLVVPAVRVAVTPMRSLAGAVVSVIFVVVMVTITPLALLVPLACQLSRSVDHW